MGMIVITTTIHLIIIVFMNDNVNYYSQFMAITYRWLTIIVAAS